MRPLETCVLFRGFTLLGLLIGGCTGVVGGTPPGGGKGTGAGGSTSSTGSGGTGGSKGGVTGSGGIGPGSGSGGTGLSIGGGGSGGVVTGTGSGAGNGTAVACDGLTSRRLRPMTIREYSNVVSDLLGAAASAAVTVALPADNLVTGFDNQGNQAPWSVSSMVSDTSDLAASLASQANPTTLAPCATAAGSATCLQTFMRSFASKAYGRPLADDEFTRLSTVANMGQDYATSVRLVVEFVLQSPNTLYVSELGDPAAPANPGKPIALTQYEVASQLSLLLTGTRPDATLLAAAQATGFTNPNDILTQAQRLLATTPAKNTLQRFIGGWMDMSPVADALKDTMVFPTLTPTILTAMQQEFDQFVTTQLNGGDGTVSSFMTASSTNVPAALASIYGTDMLPTGLDPKHRKGILSLPAVLTIHSGSNHSGPVERGLLVRRQLLCQYVPAPPPDVVMQLATNGNPLESGDTTTTTRQKLEKVHIDNVSCAACHNSFDPIGFGFEQMDGIGRFRTMENGQVVDSTGQLTSTAAVDGSNVDGAFEGPAQLAGMLAQSKLLEACMAEHFFSFAQARPVEDSDKCVSNDWATSFSQGGGHVKDLVLTSVTHTTFVTRKDDR